VPANAFLVASEFALARMRPTQLPELTRAPHHGVSSLRHAVDHLDGSRCDTPVTAGR
jgi:hypothetical protein